MSIKEVVIDTNFFMVPFQFNVDIITELENVRLNANLALKLANSSKVEIKDISLLENETVDDALLRVSEVLATNDIELKKRAKAKGITVVYLRQKNYITVDGKI